MRILLMLLTGLLVVSPTIAQTTDVTVYKSATCGCCKNWGRHMEQNGFNVTAHNVKDLISVKKQHGVTPRLSSCHTAVVEGYVIEGHVPAEDVKRLLRERPDAWGLAVAGMPIGSPGMEQGDRKDRYDVLLIDKQGKTTVYARH